MIPLNRALLGAMVLFTLNSVQAQTSANVYLQGGAQPGALACVACHGAGTCRFSAISRYFC